MIKKKRRFSSWHEPDTSLVGALLLLLAFGVLMVYDSSVVASLDLLGGQYHYLYLQLIWVVVGLLAASFFFTLDYRHLRKLALPFYLLTITFLGLVLLPTPFSEIVRGARRWFSLPFELPFLGTINFQPSEFAKLALILYLAALFTGKKKRSPVVRRGRGFLAFFLPTAVAVGLILVEPDLGTAMVVAALGLLVFFFAGAPLWEIFLLLPLVAVGGVVLVLTNPYRIGRLLSFLNPLGDPLGVSYQINQIIIALGSGGLFGLGIGESRQKYGYIPDVSTDAVFAVIGEEFGFVGTVAVIALFTFVLYRGFRIAREAPDDFGRLIAAGVTSWIGLQVLINLGAMTGLIPLTGMPLPLISYGGSSLVVLLASFGVLLNISRQTTRRRGR